MQSIGKRDMMSVKRERLIKKCFSVEEAKRYIQQRGTKIFSIRPGLTGLWQTSGRNLVVYDKRVEMEEKYIDNRTFILDLFLILKTIPLMIFPRGAF